MQSHVRVTAAILVPLLALGPSCAIPSHRVKLEPEGGSPVDFIVESGGRPIEIAETELWESFRQAARQVVAKADPLAAAEETFGLAEGSGTYRYFVRSGLLAPEALRGLEEVGGAAERMTREYQEWCGGTRMGYGDCLHLLAHSRTLTLHGRYVATTVMSLGGSFGPMLDSLKELADPNAVAVTLALAVALYLVLLLVPEPISKLISLGLTGALIGYLGLTMFWELVRGARAMASTVDSATDFSQLREAARAFGKVLGPQVGELLILLVSHSLGKGLAAKGAAGPPAFAQASAQSEQLLRVRLAAAGAIRSITLGAGVITISLATGAMAGTGSPSGQAAGKPPHPNGSFEGSPKHGLEQRGLSAPEPTNAQEVLDRSIRVKDSSPRRVGVDPETGEYAVFDQHRPGSWHGHVRTWGELTEEMRNALIKAGMTDRRGRILVKP